MKDDVLKPRAGLRALVCGILALMLPQAGQAQGYAGLDTAASGYRQVLPDRPFRFPQDHLAHPGFRIEWWYITAVMQDADGAQLGLQWTLFRQATRPDDVGEGWDNGQFWMGHAAVTTANSHHVAERFARGGIGQAGVTAGPFTAWIDSWSLTSQATGDPLEDVVLTAEGDDFSYRVGLTATGPLVPHGDNGYSVKSEAGQASHYYSQPFYRLSGEVTLDGVRRQVTGQAWLDREWSSQPLAEGQTGWDWLSLYLGDGARLMAYRLRGKDSNYTVGTWIDADGTPTPLRPGDAVMREAGREQVAGRDVPVRWHLEVPSRGVSITTEPLNAQSWMDTAFEYWEGPLSFDGSHRGQGYLEMTGY